MSTPGVRDGGKVAQALREGVDEESFLADFAEKVSGRFDGKDDSLASQENREPGKRKPLGQRPGEFKEAHKKTVRFARKVSVRHIRNGKDFNH